MHLSESERRQVGELAAGIEARTGVQVVAAVTGRCDTYPEIPWKAFALAAALAALPVALAGGTLPPFVAPLIVLGAGSVAALATAFLPAFARLFLDSPRATAETRQYAESFFLAHDLVATRQRRAILLLVGLFERQVVVLADRGLAGQIADDHFASVIGRMRPLLAAGRGGEAVLAGLAALEGLLGRRGFVTAGDGDEIADEVFEERGE